MEPKISVIVPIYNVEPWLHKSLDSLKNQTYRNLEIILVDDGSPDNCPAICDEYAARDPRFKVIHKPNGGVSSARNAGLEAVTGDWLGWVDPDDWAELDMFQYLLESARGYDADIAVCGRREVGRDSQTVRQWKELQILDREQGLELLLKNDMMQNFLWDKLFRSSLWADVRFPEGKIYEDVKVMARLFERAERIVCLPEAKYNYLMRQGSLTGERSLERRVGYFALARERYETMAAAWPRLEPLMLGQCVASASVLWGIYYDNPREVRRAFLPQLREISAFCAPHVATALQEMTLGPTGRLQVRLTPYPTWWAFALAWLSNWAYEYKHKMSS